MKKLYSTVFPIIVLIIISFIFFYQTIFFGKLPIPSDSLVGLYHPWRDYYAQDYPRGIPFKNYLITDPVVQQIPWRKIAIDQWKKGSIPWWSPYNFSGTPLLANIQAAALYPLNILFFLFSFSSAWSILIMLEPILGSIFMFLYLRHIRFRVMSSIFGAVIWAYSGFSIAWMTWGTIVHVALWIPLLLYAIDELLISKRNAQRLKWMSLFACSLLFSFFAGHAQVFLYVFLLSMIYALYQIFHIISSTKNAFDRYITKINCIWLAMGILLFILIGLIQWLPMVNLLSISSRLTEEGNWLQEGWFFPWQHFVQFLVPDFFGNPATLNYWGKWNYGEFIGYIGVLPIAFVLLSIGNLSQRNLRFWFIVLVIALACMTRNPLSQILYQYRVPVLSSLQPTRLLVIVDFALAMLAVYGFEEVFLLKKIYLRQVISIIVLGILYFSFWIFVFTTRNTASDSTLLLNITITYRNLLMPSMLYIILLMVIFVIKRLKNIQFTIFKTILMHGVGMMIIVITLFDLFRFGWKFTPFTEVQYFYPTTKIISFLQNHAQSGRVMSLNREIFPPNTSSFYGIKSVEGYDPIYSRLYEAFIAVSERGYANSKPPYGFNRIITPHNITSPVFPLLNVRYVLSFEEIKDPDFVFLFQEGKTKLYEYSKYRPLAYLVDRIVTADSEQKRTDLLFHPLVDTARDAITEVDVAIPIQALVPEERAVIEIENSNFLYITTYANQERMLVLLVPFFPSWSATIDGKSTPIYAVDIAFQGIIVPAGKHTIQFVYRKT